MDMWVVIMVIKIMFLMVVWSNLYIRRVVFFILFVKCFVIWVVIMSLKLLIVKIKLNICGDRL